MATGMPGQLEFDFTSERWTIGSWVVELHQDTASKTEKILSTWVHQKYKYAREELIHIGEYEYRVTIPKNTKTHTYIHQEAREWQSFTEITLFIEDWSKKYKFTIGIPLYHISEYPDIWSWEPDTKRISIRDIRISYIRKFGTDWPRLISKWQPINHFNYFQYLFGRYDIHTLLIWVIKRVLIQIYREQDISSRK